MDFPSWLDKSFLTGVLRERDEEQTEVINFYVKPAVPPGNNYLSQAFRVKVEYKVNDSSLKTTSLIVKAPNPMIFPENKPENKNFPKENPEGPPEGGPDDFFKQEPRVYAELLPKYHEKVNYTFSPKYYPCSDVEGLVLEDLGEDGYIMCDRFKQLDYAHCKEVIITLAKFHAVSIACHNDNTSLIKSLGLDMSYRKNDFMDEKMKAGIEFAAKKVAELTKETNKEFSDLLLSKVDSLWETSKEMFKPRKGRLNVVNHGDLWTTNILFKYSDNGDIERVKFIDYQLMRYTSPASDIVFFIWTSGNNDVRENHQQSLYAVYLQTLNTTLAELGCKERLSEPELQQELRDMADVALSLVTHVLPIFMADPDDGLIKLEELDPDNSSPDGMFQKLYNGKYYRKLLPFIARQFLPWLSYLQTNS